MKKFLSLLLATLMLLAIIPMGATASAASTPVITTSVDKTTIKAGDIVTVTVTLSADSYICAMDYELRYKSSDFEFVENSLNWKGVFPGYEMGKNNVLSSGENIFKYSGLTSSTITGPECVLFTLQLKAKNTSGKITASVTSACTSTGGADYIDVTSSVSYVSDITIQFKGPTVTPINYFDIKNPSTKSISYKSGIVLHIEEQKLIPEDAKYQWVASNSNFKTDVSADGKSCTIISNANGDTTFTVKLVTESGTVLETETITMKSKAGFFDKLIAFFRSIFGGNKVLPQ
jgi:hypothetical protein